MHLIIAIKIIIVLLLFYNIYRQQQDQKLIVHMQFCNNCQKQLSQDKFMLHLGYCQQNIIKCIHCKRPYDIHYHDQHKDQFHKILSCKFCQIHLNCSNIALHQINCIYRPIQCCYCEMPVPSHYYDQHNRNYQAPKKTCHKCNKHISNKQYFNHFSLCDGQIIYSSPSQSSSQSSSNYNSYYTYNYSTNSYVTGLSDSQNTMYCTATYYTNNSSPGYIGSFSVPRTFTSGYMNSTSYNSTANTTPRTNTSLSTGTGTTASTTQTSSTSLPSSVDNMISRRIINTRIITNPYIPQQYQAPNQLNRQTSSTILNNYKGHRQDLQLKAVLMASLDYQDEQYTRSLNQPQLQNIKHKQNKKE